MKFSRSDFWCAIAAGEAIALLSLPILKNIRVFDLFSPRSSFVIYFALATWIVFLPALSLLGLYVFYRIALLRWPVVFEIGKYGLVGWLNTFLSAGIFNFLILVSGIAKGWWADVFIVIAFIITITHSFCWNKFWIFKSDETQRAKTKYEYMKFFGVTGIVAALNAFLFHVLLTSIGAPAGIDEKIWANIAIAVLIPVAFLGNFLGYKIFVFARHIEAKKEDAATSIS